MVLGQCGYWKPKSINLKVIQLKTWHKIHHKYEDVIIKPKCMWCKYLEFEVSVRYNKCNLHNEIRNKTRRICAYSDRGPYIKGAGRYNRGERFPFSHYVPIDVLEYNKRMMKMIKKRLETESWGEKAKARRRSHYLRTLKK